MKLVFKFCYFSFFSAFIKKQKCLLASLFNQISVLFTSILITDIFDHFSKILFAIFKFTLSIFPCFFLYTVFNRTAAVFCLIFGIYISVSFVLDVTLKLVNTFPIDLGVNQY